MLERKPYDVFISYSHRDSRLVDEIARTMDSYGLHVFTDAELIPGAEVEDALWDAMAESQAFVTVVPAGESNAMTMFELGAARAWNKPVYAVVTDPASHKLPNWLRGASVYAPSGIEQIARTIKLAQEPLSEDEREVLIEEYHRIGIPADQLLLLPKQLAKLTSQFRKRTSRQVAPEELVRILLRLRKSGALKQAEARRARRPT